MRARDSINAEIKIYGQVTKVEGTVGQRTYDKNVEEIELDCTPEKRIPLCLVFIFPWPLQFIHLISLHQRELISVNKHVESIEQNEPGK